MPCHNLCSVYPLLRYQQREHYLQAQRNKQTPTTKKKVPFMQSVGEEKAPSAKPYSEEYAALKKGPWTVEEDAILLAHVSMHGDGNWNSVKKHSGISRCGKSCRLRWFNHLRPDLRRGPLQADEERLIIEQHANLGNSWSRIAAMLPGRTDNEIKNFWNTRLKRLSRAGLPRYPPPEETTSTLEDVEEDSCATCGPSIYSMASSTALNNPSDCGFNLWNWSYTLINVADLIAANALVLPAAIDGDFSGLKEAVGSKLNGIGLHKRDMPSDKRSIFNFSDVTMMQPLSKRRCLDGIILDSTVLCDPNPNPICHSSPGANLSCGTKFGYSASNMTNNLFATVRHGKGLPCLKVELHSVQSVESADSSSALSSPFAVSQALHFSDHDTLNSTCNTPVNNEGGSLLDVVFQQQKPGHDQSTSVVSEQSCAVFIMDAPVVATAPSAEDVLQTTNDNPHSLLGGYSLVLLKDDFGSGELQSDSPLPSLCGGSSLSFELPADLCEISAWTVPLFDQEEVAASAVASNVADVGHDGIGSSLWDLGSCVWSNMPGLPSSGE